jgi:hypothetical protein
MSRELEQKLKERPVQEPKKGQQVLGVVEEPEPQPEKREEKKSAQRTSWAQMSFGFI